MSARGLLPFVAAVAALAGVWAGLEFHAAQRDRERLVNEVPAGRASPPSASDLVDDETTLHAGIIPTIPDRLPPFSLQSLDGKRTAISVWKGRALILNFWATWCAPCRREMPLLKTLAQTWAPRGMTVIGVAVDHMESVRTFARELKIDYPVLVGEQESLDVAAQLGMSTPALPFTVFTDRQGEVVALFLGELHPPQAQLILQTVQQLDAGQIALTAARTSIASGLAGLAERHP